MSSSRSFLLVDLGNTRLKWAVATPAGAIRPRGEMATPEITPARIRALAREFPRHSAVISCVVPRFLPIFRRAFGPRLEIVRGDSPHLGLVFAYPHPAEIGADRIASAVAACGVGKRPVIVINCGTANAFTVLDRQGRLCGGAIAPGLQVQLQALVGATAQLSMVELTRPRRPLARSTVEAIAVGVVFGFEGGAKEIVQRLTKALGRGPRPAILLTGGHAPQLARLWGRRAQLRPLLVFEGLRMIGQRALAATL